MHYSHVVVIATDGISLDPTTLTDEQDHVIRRHVEEVMKPYQESLVVPSHDEPCKCTQDFHGWIAGECKGPVPTTPPDPACSACSGSGIVQTERNPQGYWDWWRIGGRWDGALWPDGRTDHDWDRCDRDSKCQRSDEHESLRWNLRPVHDLDPDDAPATVITPDGSWYVTGTLGSYHNEPRLAWGVVLGRYADCMAVQVDYHS